MPRELLPETMRVLARQLLAATDAEAECQRGTAVLMVIDRLSAVLTRFAGTESFTSLLRRALTLSSAENPQLQQLTVADGRLHGWSDLLALETNNEQHATIEGAVVITANLLWLLSTFIGLALTLALVRDGWPSLPLNVAELNQSPTVNEV